MFLDDRGNPGFHTKLRFRCDICNAEYLRRNYINKRMKNNPECDMDYCYGCWQRKLHKRPDYIQKMKKVNKGINRGSKNGMKQPAARKKVSIARKKMFESTELRKTYSAKTKEAWASGKFKGVKVGQCKWYKYDHSNGEVYKVQGTWELAFIKWIDDNDLEFTCHKGRIPYILAGVNKNYYPDFWIKKWDSYVDVKCKFFYDEKKFSAIRKCNPDLNLKIIFKTELIKMGAKI